MQLKMYISNWGLEPLKRKYFIKLSQLRNSSRTTVVSILNWILPNTWSFGIFLPHHSSTTLAIPAFQNVPFLYTITLVNLLGFNTESDSVKLILALLNIWLYHPLTPLRSQGRGGRNSYLDYIKTCDIWKMFLNLVPNQYSESFSAESGWRWYWWSFNRGTSVWWRLKCCLAKEM